MESVNIFEEECTECISIHFNSDRYDFPDIHHLLKPMSRKGWKWLAGRAEKGHGILTICKVKPRSQKPVEN